MESSPLAALQPSSLPGWNRQHDPSDFATNFLRPCAYETKSFNFQDMTISKPRSDYFTWKPLRGSSPTASLAADLSQNFHIDKSPQLPTPRRALFTTESAVTPPVLSSSPGMDSDMLDCSPLPHKVPCPPVFHLQVSLSAADSSFVDDGQSTLMSYNALQPSRLELPKVELPRQRRMPTCFRPSLRKGHSSSFIEHKASNLRPDNSFFLFGPASSTLPSNSALLEAFIESPPSAHRSPTPLTSTSFMGAPLPQITLPQNGSPLGGIRRVFGTRPARVGMGRRTQSLQYPNPGRTSRQEKRCCTSGSLQLSLHVEEEMRPKLPHFTPVDEPDSLPRITKETFIQVLDGTHADVVGDVTVIDCRFEYEYQGGHIEGALNYNDKEKLACQLFEDGAATGKTLILHCEYSNHRAPIMAKFIRQRDRAVNQEHYPRLTYPEIYILDGGYSSFFVSHRTRCFPQNYVEMLSKEHENACERGMAKVKRRAKLSRAQTYAFGQGAPHVAEQPLRPMETAPQLLDSMDIDFGQSIAIENLMPRRLESY